MTDNQLELAALFPAATYDDWQEAATKVLKGKSLDRLASETDDGIALKPLFTSADLPAAVRGNGVPGQAPFIRGGTARHGVSGGVWDVRVPLTTAAPKNANAEVLADLEGGASSVHIVLDRAAREGADKGNAVGAEGVAIHSLSDLETVLEGVYADLAPISVEAGGAFASAAAQVMALWQKREHDPATICGFFNADPVGALLKDGSLPGSLDQALIALVALVRHTHTTYPNVKAITVDGTIWAEGGASEGQELAAVLATALHYLRVLEEAGLPLAAAAAQIQFRLSAAPDVFAGIAKLRAFRRLWARVTEACGIEAQPAMIWADGARRSNTRRDPYVNMLRGTAATFAAAVGGADAISVRNFDEAVGQSTLLARRIARNTQMILAEESHLGRVSDPAGGAYLFEKLTDDLANAAWERFQEIERSGGIVEAITAGWLQERVGEVASKRAAAIARRKVPLTGVSEFPDVNENEPETEPRAAIELAAASDKAVPASAAMEDLVAAALEGASLSSLTDLLYEGKATEITPLPQAPFSADFDRLRDLSDMAVMLGRDRPAIFSANLGPVAKHTARASFAKNFFEAGGIVALPTEGFDDPAAMAAAFKESGAKIAILCGGDPQYEEHVAAFAPALKEAGCAHLYLAGNPGDNAGTYKEAGVDSFIAAGTDLITTLEDAFRILEVEV
ncbi:MAG: methylmalonyl-CoA mutase family protein [Alphaproteobacteria bacterium]